MLNKSDVIALRTKIAEVDKLQAGIIGGILQSLAETPDMEGVKRLSKNTIVVPFRKLSRDDWSAEHYDTQVQADKLAKTIEGRGALEKIVVLVGEILKPGKFIWKNGQIRINYRVRGTLQEIYGILMG